MEKLQHSFVLQMVFILGEKCLILMTKQLGKFVYLGLWERLGYRLIRQKITASTLHGQSTCQSDSTSAVYLTFFRLCFVAACLADCCFLRHCIWCSWVCFYRVSQSDSILDSFYIASHMQGILFLVMILISDVTRSTNMK